jgi:hypothetical protein
MVNRKIKKLIKLRAEVQARLDSIHDTDADPNIKAVYQSDLQFKIASIEDQIDFEKRMVPFQATLVGFVIAVVAIALYFLTIKQ